MGEHDVKELDSESLRAFTRKLLGDLQALELMLKHGAKKVYAIDVGYGILDQQPAPHAALPHRLAPGPSRRIHLVVACATAR